MRYRLRTLMIAMALGPPLLAWSTQLMGPQDIDLSNGIDFTFSLPDETTPILSVTTPEDTSMFRFTIRDVLWLTVVVGLVIGWGIDRWRPSNRHLQMRAFAMENVLHDEGWIVEQGDWYNIKIHRGQGSEYEWGTAPATNRRSAAAE